MQLAEQIDQALHAADPVDALRSLVLQLASQGQKKSEILDSLNSFLIRLQEEGEKREADEDVLRDVMDFLVGWCSPHVKLLPERTGKGRHEPSDL